MRIYRRQPNTTHSGGAVSVEDIRASSGEGIPICIDKDRIFSSGPQGENIVYAAYEGKRYYASNPTELVETIGTLISDGTLPTKRPILPRANTVASALVGSEMDAMDSDQSREAYVPPEGSMPLGERLQKSAPKGLFSSLPSFKPDTSPYVPPEGSKSLGTRLREGYTGAKSTVAPIGSKVSSYFSRSKESSATDTNTADETEKQDVPAGPSMMNRAKGFFTRKNRPGPRPGSVAAGTPVPVPVPVPTATKPSLFQRISDTTKKASSSVSSAVSGAFSSSSVAPRPTGTRAGSTAAATTGAPTGGSRRRNIKRKSKRSSAPTRRAHRQIKAHQ